jgi:hypothetical protein
MIEKASLLSSHSAFGLTENEALTAGPYAPPDLLWRLAASANFMRLSLREGA